MESGATHDTLATCTSRSAPAPPRTRRDPTSASSAASARRARTTRCTRSSRTRATACRGWCLPRHGVRGQSPGPSINRSAPLVIPIDSRHSGIMHFSTSATSALQMEPSIGGIFTMRSRRRIPRPQVALQGSHSAHSVTTQLLGAARQSSGVA